MDDNEWIAEHERSELEEFAKALGAKIGKEVTITSPKEPGGRHFFKVKYLEPEETKFIFNKLKLNYSELEYAALINTNLGPKAIAFYYLHAGLDFLINIKNI